jgi:hypothetical protein
VRQLVAASGAVSGVQQQPAAPTTPTIAAGCGAAVEDDCLLTTSRPGSAAAAAGVLSWLEADVAAACNAIKPRIKGGVITPLPASKPSTPRPLAAQAGATATAAFKLPVFGSDAAGTDSACKQQDAAPASALCDDVNELPAACSTAAAAAAAAEGDGGGEVHSEVWLDVKFTLVEPRVKGGVIMARTSSNPWSSSRLGCDSPTPAATAAAGEGMTTCRNSHSISPLTVTSVRTVGVVAGCSYQTTQACMAIPSCCQNKLSSGRQQQQQCWQKQQQQPSAAGVAAE